MLTEADVRRLAAEIDYYENRARYLSQSVRTARPNPLPDTGSIKSGINRIIDGDAFFIVTGTLIATDVCLLIYLAGGGR